MGTVLTASFSLLLSTQTVEGKPDPKTLLVETDEGSAKGKDYGNFIGVNTGHAFQASDYGGWGGISGQNFGGAQSTGDRNEFNFGNRDYGGWGGISGQNLQGAQSTGDNNQFNFGNDYGGWGGISGSNHGGAQSTGDNNKFNFKNGK